MQINPYIIRDDKPTHVEVNKKCIKLTTQLERCKKAIDAWRKIATKKKISLEKEINKINFFESEEQASLGNIGSSQEIALTHQVVMYSSCLKQIIRRVLKSCIISTFSEVKKKRWQAGILASINEDEQRLLAEVPHKMRMSTLPALIQQLNHTKSMLRKISLRQPPIIRDDYLPTCADWNQQYPKLSEKLERSKILVDGWLEKASSSFLQKFFTEKQRNELAAIASEIAQIDAEAESMKNQIHQSKEVVLNHQIYMYAFYSKKIMNIVLEAQSIKSDLDEINQLTEDLRDRQKMIDQWARFAENENIFIGKEVKSFESLELEDALLIEGTPNARKILLAQHVDKHTIYLTQIIRRVLKTHIISNFEGLKKNGSNQKMLETISNCEKEFLAQLPCKTEVLSLSDLNKKIEDVRFEFDKVVEYFRGLSAMQDRCHFTFS